MRCTSPASPRRVRLLVRFNDSVTIGCNVDDPTNGAVLACYRWTEPPSSEDSTITAFCKKEGATAPSACPGPCPQGELGCCNVGNSTTTCFYPIPGVLSETTEAQAKATCAHGG